MSWSTFWLIVQIVFGLLPQILAMVKEEKQKQAGRDEIIQAVLKRFQDVSQRAEDARNAARDRIDSGMPDDEFRRD